MLKVNKTFKFESGSTYSFNFCLFNTYNNLGEYKTIEQNFSGVNNTFISTIITTITAETSSKLSEVKTYDDNNPFVVGQNGVTNITYNSNNEISIVDYVINGIAYSTNLLTDKTIYSYQTKGLDSTNSDNLPVIKIDTILDVVEEKTPLNLLNVERQSQSTHEDQYRVSQIKNLEEIETYAGGNYFNIFN